MAGDLASNRSGFFSEAYPDKTRTESEASSPTLFQIVVRGHMNRCPVMYPFLNLALLIVPSGGQRLRGLPAKNGSLAKIGVCGVSVH